MKIVNLLIKKLEGVEELKETDYNEYGTVKRLQANKSILALRRKFNTLDISGNGDGNITFDELNDTREQKAPILGLAPGLYQQWNPLKPGNRVQKINGRTFLTETPKETKDKGRPLNF